MEITKITPQVKVVTRVNLYVDGKFYRGVDRFVALKLGLKPGLTLSPNLVSQLESTCTENGAWEWALKSLQISQKSERDMRRKMMQKYPATMVDELMIRLKSAGLIDDQRLAEQLVRRYLDQNTKSQKEIRLKLLMKGIGKEIVQAVMSNLPLTNTAVIKVAQIKNRGLNANLPWRERYTKIATYLTRKGFSYAEIKLAVTPESLGLEPE